MLDSLLVWFIYTILSHLDIIRQHHNISHQVAANKHTHTQKNGTDFKSCWKQELLKDQELLTTITINTLYHHHHHHYHHHHHHCCCCFEKRPPFVRNNYCRVKEHILSRQLTVFKVLTDYNWLIIWVYIYFHTFNCIITANLHVYIFFLYTDVSHRHLII